MLKFDNVTETELCDFTSPNGNKFRVLRKQVEEESQESVGTSRQHMI